MPSIFGGASQLGGSHLFHEYLTQAQNSGAPSPLASESSLPSHSLKRDALSVGSLPRLPSLYSHSHFIMHNYNRFLCHF